MMPVARYFLFVGGMLLALLFALDTYLPKPSAVNVAEASTRASGVRIRSDKKWPERIVFDTNLPTIVPAQTAAVVLPPAPEAVAVIPAKAAALDSFAQLSSSNVKQLSSSDVKKPEHKVPPKRKVAKRHIKPSPAPMMVAQQPQFGFFANNFW